MKLFNNRCGYVALIRNGERYTRWIVKQVTYGVLFGVKYLRNVLCYTTLLLIKLKVIASNAFLFYLHVSLIQIIYNLYGF